MRAEGVLQEPELLVVADVAIGPDQGAHDGIVLLEEVHIGDGTQKPPRAFPCFRQFFDEMLSKVFTTVGWSDKHWSLLSAGHRLTLRGVGAVGPTACATLILVHLLLAFASGNPMPSTIGAVSHSRSLVYLS